MNSAVYHTAITAPTARPARRAAGLRRTLARRWDEFGVYALLLSAAAYAAHALTHLGL